MVEKKRRSEMIRKNEIEEKRKNEEIKRSEMIERKIVKLQLKMLR
jgi:hypothetical protein